jgi:hypothetical protein
VPLNDTLHALVTLWTGAGGIPDAGATAAVRASVALASCKPAAEDAGLQWRCTAAAPATDARVCKGIELLLRLRGPAAAAVHRELLGQLVGALERATAGVAQAFPERKAADGGRSAASDAPAPEPAALAGASRLPPPCAGAAKHAARPQRRPTVTHPGSVALAGLITLGTCIQGVTDACLKEKGVQPLLAPGSDSGRAWAAAIAAALATAARCCTHGAPETPLEQRFSAFMAGSVLASTAAALLRLFVAAGLEALQQDAGAQLMEALAAHLAPVVGKELPPLFQVSLPRCLWRHLLSRGKLHARRTAPAGLRRRMRRHALCWFDVVFEGAVMPHLAPWSSSSAAAANSTDVSKCARLFPTWKRTARPAQRWLLPWRRFPRQGRAAPGERRTAPAISSEGSNSTCRRPSSGQHVLAPLP